MTQDPKEYFRFLVDLYGMAPDKAKIVVATWYKSCYNKKVPVEFWEWVMENYAV